jgi:hypothetical protein
MRASLLAVFILVPVGLASSARAQCELAGHGVVDAVTPVGTELVLGFDQETRVVLAGTRAEVHGTSPIVFEGEARARDVHVSLATDRALLGVVRARAGTALSVVRVTGEEVAARIDAGPTRLRVTLGCEDLSRQEPAAGAATTGEEESDEARSQVEVRGTTLVVFPTARGGRGVTLRNSGRREGWPLLAVLERRADRVRVRGPLGPDVTLDGWVDRTSVRSVPEGFTSGWPDDMGGSGGCGHGYGGETYRGPALLPAGTPLEDERGTVWGHLTTELRAEIAIASFGLTVRSSTSGEVASRTEIVWVDRLPGIVDQPCTGLGIRVARSAVTLP